MTDGMEPTESTWHDITIAGKQFTIATRYGEEHIRNVEKLVGDTMDEISSQIDAKSPINIALLTALNFADQLILREAGDKDLARDLSDRLVVLVDRLGETLNPPAGLTAE